MPPTIKVRSSPQNNGAGRDDANPNGLSDQVRPDAERGPSLQDQRHRFVASGLYILPFDLQVSSIVTIGSGQRNIWRATI